MYKWYVGGWTPIGGAETAVLDTSAMSAGDEVSCQAIPFDGYEYGLARLSEPITLAAP